MVKVEHFFLQQEIQALNSTVAGAKTSVITLGVTEGVTVSINGQEVDMSALTSTTVSYITINIQ